MSSPSSSSPFISVPALYDPVKIGLDQFIQSPGYKERLADSIKIYTEASRSLQAAEAALARFESACSKQTGSNSITLPASMRPKIMSLVHFAEVANEPDFYRDAQEKLKRIEQETSKQIYETARDAKKKLITHLQQKVNMNTFVNLQTHEFAKFVAIQVQEFDKRTASPSGLFRFPQLKAQGHFATELTAALTRVNFDVGHERDAETRREKARIEAEHQAQETVMSGSLNGQNISTIAVQAAEKTVAKLMKGSQLQGQLRPNHQAAPARDHRVSAAAANPSTGSKRPRDREQGQARSTDRERPRSPPRKQTLSTQRAGHAANVRRNTEPPAHKPISYSSAPSRSVTASTTNGHNYDPRPYSSGPRPIPVPPKNGVGGDKHCRDSSRREHPTSHSTHRRRPDRSRSRERDQERRGNERSSNGHNDRDHSSSRRH